MNAPSIARRLAAVRSEVERACAACGRDPASVTLVAVSKTWPAEAIRAAAEAGHHDFGENYVQEWLSKRSALQDLDLRWHFVGHLQSRKVREVAGRVHRLHSVDRADLAEELARRSAVAGLSTPFLIQVNVAGEASKGGIHPESVLDVANAVSHWPTAPLVGLMGLPPPATDPEASRPWFQKVRALRDRVQDGLGQALPELSMGMSGDFAVAIAEGATLVRVGTAIFGERGAGPG